MGVRLNILLVEYLWAVVVVPATKMILWVALEVMAEELFLFSRLEIFPEVDKF